MTVFMAMMLAVLTFAFVVYPFFRQRPHLAASAGDEKQQELLSKRDTAYSMLKELEFDFQSGILTEEDYRDLETRYKKKAISILKDVDTLEKGTEVEDDEIEKQVRELRRGKAQPRPRLAAESKRETTIEAEVETEVLKLRQRRGPFCPWCGARHEEGERCEANLNTGRFCPQCGARHEESDRFCSHCGANLNRGKAS